MVYYYTTSEGYTMYMGEDKHENEHLIAYGLPEDVWFHVSDLSSAHVYLRMRRGQTLNDISPETINECAVFVKANSIKGCKERRVKIVYTRWKNLHKTPAMDVGAVGFKDESKCRYCFAEKDNAIVNALNRSKEERFPDLEAEQAERAAEWRREQKRIKQAGGQISDGRVWGALMPSRTLGDFPWKDKGPGLSAEPEIVEYEVTPDDKCARSLSRLAPPLARPRATPGDTTTPSPAA